jgi:3-phosphoshikimate 1-carboxyvinyltransferase
LILESLFNTIKIGNLSNSQDTQLLKKALSEDTEIVDIHHAGTAMRFLTPIILSRKEKRLSLPAPAE